VVFNRQIIRWCSEPKGLVAPTRADSPRSGERNALGSGRSVESSSILAHSLSYSEERSSQRLGSVILGFALGLTVEYLMEERKEYIS